VPRKEEFAVFEDDGKGPMWRATFDNLDEATRYAQKRADDSRHEFFVFCLTRFVEVARLHPSQRNSQGPPDDARIPPRAPHN